MRMICDIGGLAETLDVESRSANASLLFKKDLTGVEYHQRSLNAIKQALKFNDDPVNNRRRYNAASRCTKTAINRRQRAIDKHEECRND